MSIFFPEDEGREVPEVDYQPILRTELVTGAAGPTGSQGPLGPAGPGVVTGGFTGQVLAKKSNANYDTEWVTGGGGGGAAIWGGITGTLSNQLDLQTVLDAKAPSSGISPSAISGTAVITTDSRLSDSRTPTGAASGDLRRRKMIRPRTRHRPSPSRRARAPSSPAQAFHRESRTPARPLPARSG